ncbi:MAG: hypothetical protein J6V28_00005, partial [Tidjanibacter sp.]|nr:hypothetical protein [Tidjanibacter sp.]
RYAPFTRKASTLVEAFLLGKGSDSIIGRMFCAGSNGVTYPPNPLSVKGAYRYAPFTRKASTLVEAFLLGKGSDSIIDGMFCAGRECSTTPPNLPFRRGGFLY